jgi:hypothetical protein
MVKLMNPINYHHFERAQSEEEKRHEGGDSLAEITIYYANPEQYSL